MSRICLLCDENETQEMTSNKVCDQCYDNAADYLEQNVKIIKAVPYLIDACKLALTEIDQWKEVMGGGEDPRTDAAIQALEEAMAMAA